MKWDMKVTERLDIENRHSIEWGNATWDNNDISVRNRYDTDDGRFNHSGSSELPWGDFNLMINESIKRNKFSKSEIAEILKSISEII